ncbi:hypothetical protein SV7mr_40280 [Stieleria bergensis]|uniref:DUF6268 domain-containing protein n=1 Tax=Stieleria bergensis TaxID=2528025 RepID=A0A517SZJ2_9BACT|nr:hypothetical protein SV7mr_40280 [Planctomycetes bacterium SV_7m_r]
MLLRIGKPPVAPLQLALIGWVVSHCLATLVSAQELPPQQASTQQASTAHSFSAAPPSSGFTARPDQPPSWDPYQTPDGPAAVFDSAASNAVDPYACDTPVTRDTVLDRSTSLSKAQIRKLMMPRLSFAADWYGEADDVSLTRYATRVTMPTYPFFGPPPPMINVGFSYTDLNAPAALDLPTDLYETSLTASWIRKWNQRWSFRFSAGTAFATDSHNESGDSWQFRGSAFAMYQPNERWNWTFGALALGRNDIPVLPAVGLIYQPGPDCRLDLIFPRPRLAYRLVQNGDREQWAYIGTGFSGGTWGYRQQNGTDDQITYRDWLAVVGWESTPRLAPGIPFAFGRRVNFEVGYAFGRRFEFERGRADIDLPGAATLRGSVRF